MVFTAAPIPATHSPTTCNIACDRARAIGRKLAREWIGEGVSTPFISNRPPRRFNPRVMLLDATYAQTEFVDRKLARHVQAGGWEPLACKDYVSRLFLVPKPGNNHWRPICDLRTLSKHCVRKRLKMETRVTHLTRKGDYMFRFDLQD
jgi:hypothetical protein